MQRLFRLAESFGRYDNQLCCDELSSRGRGRLTDHLAKNFVSLQILEEFRLKNCGAMRKNEWRDLAQSVDGAQH